MTDVCLTAFACSGAAPCTSWAKQFVNPPRVVWVPGANSSQFETTGRLWSQDLLGFCSNRASIPKETINRIAVITFSAGWGFLYRLLYSPSAMLKVDTVILLDGMHTSHLDNAKYFANRCCEQGSPDGDPMMIMAHSQITPAYVSSKDTNSAIFAHALSRHPGPSNNIAPDYITNAQLDKPIRLGNQYGKHTFDHDPLVVQENVGNLWRLEYEGSDAAIHIYIATQLQPRLWRWLAERWADETVGVRNNRG